PGVQTAENLHRHGVIDSVVPLPRLRSELDRALRVLVDEPGTPPAPPDVDTSQPDVPAWDSVIASRRPDRPGVGYRLRHGARERAGALRVVVEQPGTPPAPPDVAPAPPDVPAWDSVIASRRPDRPGVGYLLRHGATDTVLLSGSGGGEAATTLLALARFGGQP